MKKMGLAILTTLTCVALLWLTPGHALDKPGIDVGLVLLDSSFQMQDRFDGDEDIFLRISLDNVVEELTSSGSSIPMDSEDVVTKQGFQGREFHLLLKFKDPDGNLITAESRLPDEEPPPPLLKLLDGELVQIDLVDFLPGSREGVPGRGWRMTTDPFAVRDFYNLTKYGEYSVKCVVSMKTYPIESVKVDDAGRAFVPLTTDSWVGTISSSTLTFVISDDFDHDGIANGIDISPTQPSDAFDDDTTAGTITDRGGQTLLVTDESLPTGVRISADPAGGSAAAETRLCDGIGTVVVLTVDSGDEIIATCGSVEVLVEKGSSGIRLLTPESEDGTALPSGGCLTTLTSGNGFRFELEGPTLIADEKNSRMMHVEVDGIEGLVITLKPGEAALISPSRDGDFVDDGVDNCPETYNPDQRDDDGDGTGDVCVDTDGDEDPDEADADDDNDSIPDSAELACGSDPRDPGSVCEICDGEDNDRDGATDENFPDRDGDGYVSCMDNCPEIVNQDQTDSNVDGIGDACVTIVNGGCDTGVANSLYQGMHISRLIGDCAEDAGNHGAYVSCASALTNRLKKDGIITGKEKGAIMSCVARNDGDGDSDSEDTDKDDGKINDKQKKNKIIDKQKKNKTKDKQKKK